MEAAELLRVVVELAVASGVAIVLVLLLRAPLRRRFGAAAGYGAWWLVPVSMIAVLLPAAPAASPGVSMVLAIGDAVPQALAAGAVDGGGGAPAWLVIWLSGTVVMALAFARRQRRFRRALGRLRPRGDGLLQAAGRGGLPATVGLFPPRIVVPVDFDRAYSDEQRRLMLAHERCHVRHGDLQANAAVLALRCALWFNPLVHLAARHFRHDQELACDQRVVARHPHARRAYGEAMFKAQLAAQPLPLGCHWGYGHPLKERIAMLRQPVPTRSRRLGGILAVVALGLATGYGAWAAQPASQPVLVVSPAGHMPPPPPPPAAPEPPPAPPAPLDAGVPVPPAPPAPPAAPPPPPGALPANRTPPPRYPAAAIEQGIEGAVVLVVEIDAEGRPLDVEVEKSEPAGVFDQAAIDAASQWRFTPALENGKAVPGRVRVPIEFRSTGMEGGQKGIRLEDPALPASVAEVRCSALTHQTETDEMTCIP